MRESYLKILRESLRGGLYLPNTKILFCLIVYILIIAFENYSRLGFGKISAPVLLLTMAITSIIGSIKKHVITPNPSVGVYVEFNGNKAIYYGLFSAFAYLALLFAFIDKLHWFYSDNEKLIILVITISVAGFLVKKRPTQ